MYLIIVPSRAIPITIKMMPAIMGFILEHAPAYGLQPARHKCSLLVHEMVEQIPKARHHTGRFGRVVVGAEDCRQSGIRPKRGANPPERVLVREDVGVDEDKYVTFRPHCPGVAGRGRPATGRLFDDDHLLGGIVGSPNGRHAAGEPRRRVTRGHDRTQAHSETSSLESSTA